jgi:AcrR family transcriptional regulator
MDPLDKRREEILDAAMLCLARYGPIKSTLDDIAQILGMKKASLYYYYKNKEAIFRDALERERCRLFEQVQQKIKSKRSVSSKLVTMIRMVHAYFRDRAEMLEFNIQAMQDNHAMLRSLSREMREHNMDFLAHMIREGVEKGEFRKIDAFKVAHALRLIFDTQRFELYHSMTERKPSREEYNALEENAVFILELFLNGLKQVN